MAGREDASRAELREGARLSSPRLMRPPPCQHLSRPFHFTSLRRFSCQPSRPARRGAYFDSASLPFRRRSATMLPKMTASISYLLSLRLR